MSDYTVVYFKNLKRGLSVPSTLADFSIGGLHFEIKFYGAIIAVGFLLAVLATSKLCKKKNINPWQFYDVLIWGTLFGIIGARIFYVVFSWDYYSMHPEDIWKIHDGGLAIYGGVIAGLLTAIVAGKRKKSFDFLDALDLGGVGFLIGQGIGRWGNFTNQEAFGTNTDLPWGMTSAKVREYIITHQDFFHEHDLVVSPDKYVHPTFLYESIWCIIGFFILYWVFSKRRKFKGEIILMYLVWYGLERSVVEGLRTDSLYVGSTTIRISQILAIITVVVALIFLVKGLVKHKNDPPLPPEPVREEE